VHRTALLTVDAMNVHRHSRASVGVTGTLTGADGRLLAEVTEPDPTSWNKAYRVWYAFANPKRGLRPLRHRLEVREPNGGLLFGIVKHHEYGLFSRKRISVFAADHRPAGTVEEASVYPFQSRFRLMDADRRRLADLRPVGRLGALNMRYAVIDPAGREIAHTDSVFPDLGSEALYKSVLNVTFERPPPTDLRILVLSCAIGLRLLFTKY
jgi:hypothetical protein